MTNDNKDADLAQVEEQVKLLTNPQMAGSILGFWIFAWMMLWGFLTVATLGIGLYKQYFFLDAVMSEGIIAAKSSETYLANDTDMQGRNYTTHRSRTVVDVRFPLADGQTVTVTHRGGYNSGEGDVIDVWYNPARPKDIRLAEDKETANLLCMISAGTALLTALCWALLKFLLPAGVRDERRAGTVN